MSIYYSDEHVTLHHGDWREIIDPTLRADLIVTDPPYGETALDWDRWPDGWPSLAAHHADSMWCWGSMRMFLDRGGDFTDWKFGQDLVWEKHNGSNLANDRFARVHENALHWYRGAWRDIYKDPPKTNDATRRAVRKKARPAHWIGATGPSVFVSEDGGPRLMRSVLFERCLHGNAENETQKPVSFLEHLITYGCPPGGLVLDVFAGAGSTGVAAKRVGRRAVLFELREAQCEAAAKRLTQHALDFGEAS